MSRSATFPEIVRTLKLRTPIEVAGQPVEQLEFRRPKAGMVRKVAGLSDEGEQALALVAGLTNTSRDSIADLDWRDFVLAQGIVSELMPQNPDGAVEEGTGKGETPASAG